VWTHLRFVPCPALSTDHRIRLLTNKSNLGLIASLNLGLEAARADLVARMDADDVARPERLQKQYDFMQSNPEIGVVGTAVEIFRTTEGANDVSASASAAAFSAAATSAAPTSSSRIIRHPTSSACVAWSLPFYCCLAHPSVMYRRKIVREKGGYEKGWTHAEDYELWLRLQRAGVKMANVSSKCRWRRA
jgi:cellulose synthase/poly-beta-1,6-N-acetylglucosamine synthase-like glycosyltransferase